MVYYYIITLLHYKKSMIILKSHHCKTGSECTICPMTPTAQSQPIEVIKERENSGRQKEISSDLQGSIDRAVKTCQSHTIEPMLTRSFHRDTERGIDYGTNKH